MIDYTCSLLFGRNFSEVLLIHKKRPDWQSGLLNGIGGKIELTDININEAASREIQEESGLFIEPNKLILFCEYIVNYIPNYRCASWRNIISFYRIYFFTAYNIPIHEARSMTDEKVECFSVQGLPKNIVRNLKWLIPLALDENNLFPVRVEEKTQ